MTPRRNTLVAKKANSAKNVLHINPWDLGRLKRFATHLEAAILIVLNSTHADIQSLCLFIHVALINQKCLSTYKIFARCPSFRSFSSREVMCADYSSVISWSRISQENTLSWLVGTRGRYPRDFRLLLEPATGFGTQITFSCCVSPFFLPKFNCKKSHVAFYSLFDNGLRTTTKDNWRGHDYVLTEA